MTASCAEPKRESCSNTPAPARHAIHYPMARPRGRKTRGRGKDGGQQAYVFCSPIISGTPLRNQQHWPDGCVYSCRAAIKTALGTLRVRMPQALILWSSILPRIVYHGKRPTGSTSQEALEGVRVSLNNYARRQANRMGNASVTIHDIDRSNHNMFIRDGVHLSDQGSDILIASFALAIRKALFE